MAELTVSYKFFSLEPAEVKIEHGKYPLDSIVPFGPPHHNERLCNAVAEGAR